MDFPLKSQLAPLRDLRRSVRRKTLRQDATAGVVLGVESVPDGLANGLLAGVNPVSGVYAYLFGMLGGSLLTSTALMSIQGTGAMAIIVADVDLAGREDPSRALFTLTVLTGVVMIAAGALGLGRILRFVSTSVMTGFVTAVGLNIILGQLATFTGYDPDAGGRLENAVSLLVSFWRVDLATTLVGVVTVALVIGLGRTRLGALGLVVAVVVGSGLAALLNSLGTDVATVADVADLPNALPTPTLPVLGEIPGLLVPALSLAFVGLVQGAAVSAGVPNPDGSFGDRSQDFVGQGAGNLASGVFQGLPVGGSMSATSLAVTAGARSRLALVIGAAVMAFVVVVLGDVVTQVAMPVLAALLIVAGATTIKPNQIANVAQAGRVQLAVLITTFALTVVLPVQYAVVAGVATSILLHITRQSVRLATRRLVFSDDGRMREQQPPAEIGRQEIVVLQPYGSLFFATARALEDQLPDVTADTDRSVVILRLRGVDDVGATLTDVLARYATALDAAASRLMVVTDNPRLIRQLQVTGALGAIGADNVLRGTEWVGETIRRANDEAEHWVSHGTAGNDPDPR
ncbi:SulP family inorganic anion transporter [Solirubrobacter phytolaccae]|uniref:SulP family inorganic anion transporter n=1 Tax=Solirubrobacter phytolaccae TaxID=1404360 RepID=A0A9X3N8U3_9ACTN|nr:SulP family inorganic anion transporter [Solirubrobacter phytolaccae]MDA0180382.1 SulP family inorganic anion transporter [Solirubrobacter phytolaccae]